MILLRFFTRLSFFKVVRGFGVRDVNNGDREPVCVCVHTHMNKKINNGVFLLIIHVICNYDYYHLFVTYHEDQWDLSVQTWSPDVIDYVCVLVAVHVSVYVLARVSSLFLILNGVYCLVVFSWSPFLSE